MVLAVDWLGGGASETGEDQEPVGLLVESGEPLISAVLVVAVMGRWGIRMATGAVCSSGKLLGGEIFPCTNTECSVVAACPFSSPAFVGAGSTSIGSSRSILLVLLDTAKVARLEKRAVDGLLLATGPVTMEDTFELTGGLLELGEDEKVAGGDAGLD